MLFIGPFVELTILATVPPLRNVVSCSAVNVSV
jgi:hypothetical protein